MTAPDDDFGARLHDALARSVASRDTSPAPVERVLAAGRARRARRRTAAVAASAACVVAVGLAVSLPRPGARTGPGPARSGPPASATAPTAGPVTTALVAHGTVDGTPWSVRLEYHAALPSDHEPPSPLPGASAGRTPTALLCQRMVIGGVLVDHQGGPWADCLGVRGAYDTENGDGEEGLWGLHDKGTRGLRLFVARCGPGIESGTVTLTDGTRLTARAVTVPGTGYRGWAVAIPDGRTIASVDQYDGRHHRVTHETEWR